MKVWLWLVREMGWYLCEGRWNGSLEVVIYCHSSSLRCHSFPVQFSFERRFLLGFIEDTGLAWTVFLCTSGVALSRSIGSKVPTIPDIYRGAKSSKQCEFTKPILSI
jgi:hypothetical protein